jgi:hypothetical protein
VLRHEPESGPSTSLSYARTGTRLASVESQGLAHVWDPTGSPDLARQMARLKPEVLWAELIGNDPVRAHQAFWLLAKTPDDTLKLARKYPIPAPVDQKAVKRWISQLDDESFEVRQTATAELEKEGQRAEPYLRRALEGRPQLEARRRIERLLGKLPDWPYTTERVRTARVLALLERLGTRGAREVLEQRAKSDPDSWSSKEAKSALDRLNNSPRK